MADAALSFEDPSTESFGGDIVVHGNKAPAPAPIAQPAIGASGTNDAAPAQQPVGISFDDFFGKPKAAAQPTQGTAPQAVPAGAPASGQQGVSFEDFFGKPKPDDGPLQNSGDESYLSGLAKGGATAVIKGISDIPGFAGNLHGLADYLYARGQSAITGEDVNDIMQRHQQNMDAMDADMRSRGIPVLPQPPSGADIAAPILAKTGDYTPDTEWGKIGQAGLEGAIASAAPGGIGSKTGAAVPGALASVAKEAPIVAASTGAGQGVTDETGDPLLGMAAGVAGGAAVKTGASAAAKIAKPIVASLPGSVGDNMAQRMAGEQLAATASDPQALRDTLNGTGAQTSTPVVPGSKPTLGQLSGDMGILQAERAARVDDVSPFNEREAQQNTARRNQIAGQAPANADVMRPAVTFRDRLNHIDKATQQAVDMLTKRAQAGGQSLGTGGTPEARGNAIRTAIEASRKVARDIKTRLYDAVDPEDKLNLVAAPVREAAEKIAGSLDPLDEAPTGREASLLNDVKGLPDVLPFKSLRALDKRVTTAMKEARRAGEDTVHRRLTMLKGAVQDAIDNGVENQILYESRAVGRGEMAPEETIGVRLAKEAESYVANKDAVAASGGGSSANASGRSSTISGANGAEIPPTGRSGNGAANSGISQEELSPNFDAAAAGRLKSAKTYYKNEYAPTYKEGSVARVLAGPFIGKYNVIDSAVPSQAILKGDRGFEAAQSFIKATRKSPEAIGAMADQLVAPLREGLLPIGAVSPSKFAKWKSDYGPALRAIDEHVPGFSGRFDTAARATDAMIEAGRLREEAIDQFQKGAAGQFLGGLGKNDPSEVEAAVGKILSDKAAGPTRMEALVKAASKDPEAVAGLKKAGVDWMLNKFSTTAEAGTSGNKLLSSAGFQKFISDNRATIQKLYGSDGLGIFGAVAHDLERANRPISATRIGGSPGTAHDVKPMLSANAKKVAGHTSMMVAMIEGVHLGYEHGGLKGAALAGGAGAASYLAGTLRHAGLNKVDALVRDALLNPERARVYLSKAPTSPDSGRFLGLASSIRRQLIGTPIVLHNQSKAH